MNQPLSKKDQLELDDLDLLINQMSYQANGLYFPSMDQTAELPAAHPLYMPASHQASSQPKTSSSQPPWRPLSPSVHSHQNPALPTSATGDVHQKPSRWNHSTSKTALPIRPKPPTSQSSFQDLDQNRQSSLKTMPPEVKRRRGRRPKTVSQLPISSSNNVDSSSTSTVTNSVAGKDSSVANVADFCIQNIMIPNLTLDSVIISDLILETFDKVVVPSYAGNSPLEIQIKAHVTRHILSQNLPRVINPLFHIMNQLNTSDLINIVIYALQLSGVSL